MTNATTVGAVKYDASFDLPSLRKSAKEAEKIVQQSYDKMAKASQKASKSTSSPTSSKSSGGTTSYEAQTRVNELKREAQGSLNAISQYTPQIQKQFLSVERANNQVYNATVRSTQAMQRYGTGSVQATKATNSLSVAVQNQSQQQSKLDAMLNGTYQSQNTFNQSMNDGISSIGGVVAALITLQSTTQLIKSSVAAANEYQASLTGLSRLSRRFGEDSDVATAAARELASDGLITVSTAAGGLQKLLTAGVGLPQAIELMKGYKDQAAFGRSSTINLDTAVGNLAESFYTENSAIGNLSGQTENWNQIMEYGASVIGKNVSQLTEKERVQAKLIGQQRLNNLVEGDAAVYAQTNAGAQQQLNAVLKNMQVTIGRVSNSLSSDLIRALGGLDAQTQNSIISFGAGVATFGAFVVLAPRIVGGIKTIITAMRALTVATALSSGGLTVLLGAVAGVAAGAYIDSLINGLDESGDAAADTAGSVNEVAGGLGTASNNAKDLSKQLGNINEQMQDVRQNYRESLAKLVRDKNENIAELRRTLKAEEKAYNNAYDERLTSYNKTENEQLVTHQQKTRALQNQIDFLSQYNTTANNQQVEELKFALARENEEYKKSTQLRKGEFDAETKAQFTEYEKRRAENQKKLNAELALLQKHRGEVLKVRGVILLDEIQQLKRSRDEQLKSLRQQAKDAAEQGANIGKALGTSRAKAEVKWYTHHVEGTPIVFRSKNKKDIDRGFSVQEYNGSKYVVPAFSSGGFTGRGAVDDVAGIVHKGEYVLPQSAVNQSTGMPDWDKIAAGGGQSVNVNVSLSGVMTSSRADERAVATRIARLIDEATTAKTGKKVIGIS